jgi:hypothetical protein
MPSGTGSNTPRVTTGNVRTTFDVFSPAPGPSTPGPTPAPFSGLTNPLGAIYTDVGGTDSISGTLVQLPLNVGAIYKYVLYKSATNPALVTGPAPVYYTDNTKTVVSGAAADAFPAPATPSSALAGVLMPNTTDLPNLTAAILNNGGNGSGVWICIGGFVKASRDVGAVAVAGTQLVGGVGNFTWALVAAFAATAVYSVLGLTNTAGGFADISVFGLSESV